MDLVYDRTAQDVAYIKGLISKASQNGWESLSEDERYFYLNGNAIEGFDSDGDALYDSEGERIYYRTGVIRGAYNASDLNRVMAAMEYLAEKLLKCGYAADGYNPKLKEWENGDIPRQKDIILYLQNISAIRNIIALPPDAPEAPASTYINYHHANDIERLMEIVQDQINLMKTTYIPCGTAVCGGDNL